MNIEHIALNVKDPDAVCAWYCQELGMTLCYSKDDSAKTRFLADSSGSMMIELYCNPPNEVPDYASMNPLQLHIAFVSENPGADSKRLVSAGAKVVDEVKLDDGSHLIMLKDPWGLSVQLCRRGG